ncbi:hypothetical protein cypCar_00032930, partial [Cyprinus carpio]
MPAGPLPPMPPPFPPENPPLPEHEERASGSEEEYEYESGDEVDKESSSGPAMQTSDGFEPPQTLGQKKIEFYISAEVSTILEGPRQNQEPQFADATKEIKKMSVFKNYEPGEPTSRLYVKNIAKQVEEK